MFANNIEETVLREEVGRARQAAYAAYSDFLVGAVLVGKSGRLYRGCNVENASYPAGICAERAALVRAVSEGEREFSLLALAGGPREEDFPRRGCMPCGICRQMLSEFCGPDFKILSFYGGEGVVRTTLGALLPESFGPESL